MSLGRAARRVAGIAGAVSEASICSPATWRSAEAVAKVVVPEESVALSRIIAGASRATLRRAGKAAKDYVEKPAAEFRKSVVERAKKSYRKGVDAHLSDPAANPADAELAGIGRAVVDTGISNAKFYIKAQAKHAKSILLRSSLLNPCQRNFPRT